MENENPDTPNNFYDYDDKITRMMQERDAWKSENSWSNFVDMINSPHVEQAIMTREYRYTAAFEPAEEGGFVVSFTVLPGLIAVHNNALKRGMLRATSGKQI